jgi:hypothetical protein
VSSLNNNNRKRQIHNRTPLTYRKGKQRLRILTLKQLYEIAEREKTGKRFAKVMNVIRHKEAQGIVWHQPVEETNEEENGSIEESNA